MVSRHACRVWVVSDFRNLHKRLLIDSLKRWCCSPRGGRVPPRELFCPGRSDCQSGAPAPRADSVRPHQSCGAGVRQAEFVHRMLGPLAKNAPQLLQTQLLRADPLEFGVLSAYLSSLLPRHDPESWFLEQEAM
jgi:hypothetical protein